MAAFEEERSVGAVVAVRHGVAVALADAVGDGVEARVGELRGTHAHVVGQAAVDGHCQSIDGDARVRGEGRHLSDGMHPGIGAAGAHHRDAGTDRNGHCLLQHALHGSQRRQSWRLLPLPAVEVGAVVGDDQSEARHAGRIGKTCRGILVIGISQALLFILLTIRDGMGALGKQVLDFVRAGSTVVLRRLPVYADPESLSPRRRASSHFPTESPEK